jgi:hypothetical protein
MEGQIMNENEKPGGQHHDLHCLGQAIDRAIETIDAVAHEDSLKAMAQETVDAFLQKVRPETT